jgi:predicted hydrocarbon binding protein
MEVETMTDQSFVNFERRGIIKVGEARMILLDILGGFNALQEAVEEFIGSVASKAIYNAGEKGGTSFTNYAVEAGIISKDKEGFLGCLDAYSEAGFGDYQAREIDFSRGVAIVTGTDSFESFNSKTQKKEIKKGVCNYTRGVILSFMKVLSGVDDLECVELSCEAMGESSCEFKIAPRDELRDEGHLV